MTEKNAVLGRYYAAEPMRQREVAAFRWGHTLHDPEDRWLYMARGTVSEAIYALRGGQPDMIGGIGDFPVEQIRLVLDERPGWEREPTKWDIPTLCWQGSMLTVEEFRAWAGDLCDQSVLAPAHDGPLRPRGDQAEGCHSSERARRLRPRRPRPADRIDGPCLRPDGLEGSGCPGPQPDSGRPVPATGRVHLQGEGRGLMIPPVPLFFAESDVDRMTEEHDYLFALDGLYIEILLAELQGAHSETLEEMARQLLAEAVKSSDPIAVADCCQGLAALACRQDLTTLALDLVAATTPGTDVAEVVMMYAAVRDARYGYVPTAQSRALYETLRKTPTVACCSGRIVSRFARGEA